MRYLIIGLGIYGSNLARDLTDMGHEVIGADLSSQRVDAIKDYISTAYILDAADEASIAALPLKNVDLVVVAIGENFGASVKCVALLKKYNVANIYARAIDDIHQAILEGLKVQRILTPEQRAAHDLVNEMALGTRVETLRVDADIYVAKFRAPEYFYSMRYCELTTERLYGLKLVAATRPTGKRNILGLERDTARCLPIAPADWKCREGDGSDTSLIVEAGDCFVCYGPQRAFRDLFKHL